jgi:hypothetical protein
VHAGDLGGDQGDGVFNGGGGRSHGLEEELATALQQKQTWLQTNPWSTAKTSDKKAGSIAPPVVVAMAPGGEELRPSW